MKQIIKGLIYTNGEVLLRPHYSGNFFIVDCTQYVPKPFFKEHRYEKKFIKDIIENSYQLKYNNKIYYECEYNCYNTINMELLSDISKFDLYDFETEFND